MGVDAPESDASRHTERGQGDRGDARGLRSDEQESTEEP